MNKLPNPFCILTLIKIIKDYFLVFTDEHYFCLHTSIVTNILSKINIP